MKKKRNSNSPKKTITFKNKPNTKKKVVKKRVHNVKEKNINSMSESELQSHLEQSNRFLEKGLNFLTKSFLKNDRVLGREVKAFLNQVSTNKENLKKSIELLKKTRLAVASEYGLKSFFYEMDSFLHCEMGIVCK